VRQITSEIIINTNGEGFTDITFEIENWIKEEKVRTGLLLIFCKHTSCSLLINENADPNVLKDLGNYINAIVPQNKFQSIDGSKKEKQYLHSEEGLDDMPAHIKTMLTSTNLSLSINESKLVLGTWQAVYLWEHRTDKMSRTLYLHLIGEVK